MSRVIAVKPLPDGVNMRGSWKVTMSNAQKSTHTKKSAAKRTARNMAQPGDTIEIHRTDGTIQDRYTYNGSQSGSSNTSPGHAWDVDDIADDYDGMTDLF